MDKQNKIRHTWIHHAKWGDPTRKLEGIGEVEWHSLTENGKVEIVDIRFGDKLYEDVPISELEPIDMKEHSHHKRSKRRKKKNESSIKEMLDDIILDVLKDNNAE